MPTTAQGGNLSLTAAEVYFDRWTSAGAKTGERFLGTCDSLKVNTSVEKKEKFNASTAARELLASAITKVTREGTLVMNEQMAENLALWALGAADEFTQTATPVVDENLNGGVAIPTADAWYPVASGARKLTSVSVKVGASTKTLGTDYLVDAEGGRIYIVKGGTIVVGTDIVKASYTPTLLSAGSGLARVKGGTVGKIEGLMRVVCVPNTGPTWEYVFWKVSLTPEGDLDLFGEEYGSYTLKLAVLADGVHTEPWQAIRRAA